MNASLAQGAALAHDSALGHVTGRAPFADDVPEAPGLLHGVLLLAPVAHGRLEALDVAAARAMPGVVAVITAREVLGANDISPSGREVEPLFAEGELRHHGQPIAMVVGETRDAALAALAALKPEIEALPAILSIEDALTTEAYLLPPQEITVGDAASAIAASPMQASGEFRAGGQEHFYLEGQIAIAIPGEDGDIAITSSTQHPT